MKEILLLLNVILFSISGWGQLKLEGVYKGANLYIHNPMDSNEEFCIDSVVVNGSNYEADLNQVAFEIDFNSDITRKLSS